VRPPVLVFGTGLTALGVVRALGRRGIVSLVVDTGDSEIRWSRWYRPAPARPSGRPTAALLAGYLDTLDLDRAVLFGCTDDWVRALAALDPSLGSRFNTSLPEGDVLARLVDKGGLAEALRSAGVPHPQTHLLRTEEDLSPITAHSHHTYFLKPADSQRFGKVFDAKALRVADRNDAADKLRQARAAGLDMLLQEYVPGPATNHYFVDGFVDVHGVMRAAFARQRYRMYPSDFGNSSYMASVPVATVQPASVPVATVQPAVESLERLFERERYRGIYSAEFKRDANDGLFKLLEVNVRPWWYVEFAARCGVDVVDMYYRDALGQPVDTTTAYRTGERLIHAWCDWKAWTQRERTRPAVWAHWGAWIGSHRGHFAWDDPLPAVAGVSRSLTRRLGRVLSAGRDT
jgi:predicted ATP-grasp superfamily ATP-dependent carboligase